MRETALRALLIIPVLALTIIGPGAAVPAQGQVRACGAGFGPCRCGDTVVVDTKLDGTDPVLSTPCPCVGLLVISGVTLVIGGTIRAASGNTCAGIVVPPRATDVVVTTGRIVGFETAVEGGNIAIFGVRRSEFSRLQVVDNNLGISILGDDNLIARNVSTRSQFVGIGVSGARNVVTLNRTQEGQHGFDVDGSENVVSRNVALRHQLDGITISGERALVERNRSQDNDGAGFVISQSNHTVSLNIAQGNASDGFFIPASDSRFTRNRSSYNGGFGLDVLGNSLSGNTFTDNLCTGNLLGDSHPPGLCF